MSGLKNGLVFAMESDEEVTPPVVPEMVPETQAEVETAAAEVTEQVGEIEEMDTAVDSAEADAGTLSDIQDVMAESVEKDEGLSETAAEIAEVAIESIRIRLGMKQTQPVIPSLESFGSKSSRVTATKIAMEGVGEMLKKIWENILKAVNWVWEKIKSFFLSLTKNRAALLKHLQGLQASAKALKADPEGVVTGNVVKAFNIDGKTDFGTAETVLANSETLLESVNAGAKFAANLAGKLLNVESEGTALKEAGSELFQGISEGIGKLGKVASLKTATNTEHFGNLAFGRSVAVMGDKKLSVKSISIALDDNSKPAAANAPALTQAQMDKLLTSAVALVKNLQQYDAVERDLTKITKACESVSKAAIGAAASAAGGKKEEAMKVAAANVRALNAMVSKFGASLPSAVFQAGKAAGDYVSASMGAKKAKVEEKKEEKKD